MVALASVPFSVVASPEVIPAPAPLVPIGGPSRLPRLELRSARRPTKPTALFPARPAIFPWLEAAFVPGTATRLIGPTELVGGFLPFVLTSIAATGQEVSLRDGGNRFSPYVLGALSRHLDVAPQEVLARISLARAFTAYQMVTLIERWADSAASQEPAPSLLVASDPSVIFDAEEVAPDERSALLAHVASCLGRLVRAARVPLLVTGGTPATPFPGWERGGPPVHETLRLVPRHRGVTVLVAERRAASLRLVALAADQHRLDEFGTVEETTDGSPGGGALWDGPFPLIGTR